MIPSKVYEFCDQQAITVAAASDGYVEGANMGRGHPMPVNIQLTEDFAGTATSLTIKMQDDDTTAWGDLGTVAEESTVLIADLKAGYRSKINYMPPENRKFVRLFFQPNGGTFTAGKISAHIVYDAQDRV